MIRWYHVIGWLLLSAVLGSAIGALIALAAFGGGA